MGVFLSQWLNLFYLLIALFVASLNKVNNNNNRKWMNHRLRKKQNKLMNLNSLNLNNKLMNQRVNNKQNKWKKLSKKLNPAKLPNKANKKKNHKPMKTQLRKMKLLQLKNKTQNNQGM